MENQTEKNVVTLKEGKVITPKSKIPKKAVKIPLIPSGQSIEFIKKSIDEYFKSGFQTANTNYSFTKEEIVFLKNPQKMLDYFFEDLPPEEQKKTHKLVENSDFLLNYMSGFTTSWLKNMKPKKYYQEIINDLKNKNCYNINAEVNIHKKGEIT